MSIARPSGKRKETGLFPFSKQAITILTDETSPSEMRALPCNLLELAIIFLFSIITCDLLIPFFLNSFNKTSAGASASYRAMAATCDGQDFDKPMKYYIEYKDSANL